MFTTGFKFFFGIAAALVTASVVYGYSTGGGGVGPVTLGWKGGVGDHVGYVLLFGLGLVASLFAFALVSFRDADHAAQAHYLGIETVAPTTDVTGTLWPVVAAAGAGTAAVGLVLHPAVFVVGLALTSISAISWTMDAWADRATGDSVANRALRNRVMAPFEIPIAGAGLIGVMVLAISRILLNASPNGAVFFASALAVVILALGTLYAAKPDLNKKIIPSLVLVAVAAVLVGGVLAAIDGERQFHPHDVHQTDSHSEDGTSE